MKKNIHPENYRLVVFKDMSNGDTFITKSCADSKETIQIDGKEYPLIKREISNTSHPFYTGKMKLVDTAGRVDKFYKKFGKAALPKTTNSEETSKNEEASVVEASPQKEEAPVAEASPQKEEAPVEKENSSESSSSTNSIEESDKS